MAGKPRSDDAQSPFRPGDALIVVDVQRDFCPGGSLPIEGGDKVVPVLNDWMAKAEEASVPVFASRDWHPPDHLSFKPQGGKWPVHCVQETEGANFHPDLKLPDDAVIVTKGDRGDRDQYSAFDATGLADDLREKGVGRVWIGGLAEDVCVRATALDAAKEGFRPQVIAAATKPVSAAGGETARADMRNAGATIVE